MKPAHTRILALLTALLTALLFAGCTTDTAQRPPPDKTAAEEQDPNAPAMGPLFMPMR
jgi:hypothetical protein|uniref:hypothetical protein n=1 Tax=Prosthecobacter sp. TaxID=1965333 RepID=UPI003784F764